MTDLYFSTNISRNTKYVFVYLFLFLYVSLLGNSINQTLNQIILWAGGPIIALVVLAPRIKSLPKLPAEYLLYGSLLLFALIGMYNVKDWSGFYRYFQVITANLILMLIIYYSVNTWREIKVIMLSIWLACMAIVISSYLFEFNPVQNDEEFRFSGMAGNANGLANFARVGILIGLFGLCSLRTALSKIVIYFSIGLLAYAVLITASRGSFINVVFVLSAFFGIRYLAGWRLVVFVAITYISGQFLFSFLENLLSDFYLYERFSRNESLESLAQNEARIILYQNAWETFVQHPFFGVGLNQFRLYSGGKISHTDILDIAVQLGIFAALAYMSIYYRLLLKMLKSRKTMLLLHGKRVSHLLVIIFISEMIFGITNPNWFSQVQMILLSMLIVIYYKVLPIEQGFLRIYQRSN